MTYCFSKQPFDETAAHLKGFFSCVFSDGPEAALDILVAGSLLLQLCSER